MDTEDIYRRMFALFDRLNPGGPTPGLFAEYREEDPLSPLRYVPHMGVYMRWSQEGVIEVKTPPRLDENNRSVYRHQRFDLTWDKEKEDTP